MELAQMSGVDDGVWVVYSNDMGTRIVSIHRTEIDALRVAVSEGVMNKVCFVRYGEDTYNLS